MKSLSIALLFVTSSVFAVDYPFPQYGLIGTTGHQALAIPGGGAEGCVAAAQQVDAYVTQLSNHPPASTSECTRNYNVILKSAQVIRGFCKDASSLSIVKDSLSWLNPCTSPTAKTPANKPTGPTNGAPSKSGGGGNGTIDCLQSIANAQYCALLGVKDPAEQTCIKTKRCLAITAPSSYYTCILTAVKAYTGTCDVATPTDPAAVNAATVTRIKASVASMWPSRGLSCLTIQTKSAYGDCLWDRQKDIFMGFSQADRDAFYASTHDSLANYIKDLPGPADVSKMFGPDGKAIDHSEAGRSALTHIDTSSIDAPPVIDDPAANEPKPPSFLDQAKSRIFGGEKPKIDPTTQLPATTKASAGIGVASEVVDANGRYPGDAGYTPTLGTPEIKPIAGRNTLVGSGNFNADLSGKVRALDPVSSAPPPPSAPAESSAPTRAQLQADADLRVHEATDQASGSGSGLSSDYNSVTAADGNRVNAGQAANLSAGNKSALDQVNSAIARDCKGSGITGSNCSGLQAQKSNLEAAQKKYDALSSEVDVNQKKIDNQLAAVKELSVLFTGLAALRLGSWGLADAARVDMEGVITSIRSTGPRADCLNAPDKALPPGVSGGTPTNTVVNITTKGATTVGDSSTLASTARSIPGINDAYAKSPLFAESIRNFGSLPMRSVQKAASTGAKGFADLMTGMAKDYAQRSGMPASMASAFASPDVGTTAAGLYSNAVSSLSGPAKLAGGETDGGGGSGRGGKSSGGGGDGSSSSGPNLSGLLAEGAPETPASPADLAFGGNRNVASDDDVFHANTTLNLFQIISNRYVKSFP